MSALDCCVHLLSEITAWGVRLMGLPMVWRPDRDRYIKSVITLISPIITKSRVIQGEELEVAVGGCRGLSQMAHFSYLLLKGLQAVTAQIVCNLTISIRSSDRGGVPFIRLHMLWSWSLSFMINKCTQQSKHFFDEASNAKIDIRPSPSVEWAWS